MDDVAKQLGELDRVVAAHREEASLMPTNSETLSIVKNSCRGVGLDAWRRLLANAMTPGGFP